MGIQIDENKLLKKHSSLPTDYIRYLELFMDKRLTLEYRIMVLKLVRTGTQTFFFRVHETTTQTRLDIQNGTLKHQRKFPNLYSIQSFQYSKTLDRRESFFFGGGEYNASNCATMQNSWICFFFKQVKLREFTVWQKPGYASCNTLVFLLKNGSIDLFLFLNCSH